ncbi:Maltose excess protein 1, chloroplastic [Linum perenne]
MAANSLTLSIRNPLLPPPSRSVSLSPWRSASSSLSFPAVSFRKSSAVGYSFAPLHLRRRSVPPSALESDVPRPLQTNYEVAVEIEKTESFQQWDSWTAKFAAAANLPFLLLQLPQIKLNAQNLAAGNNAALLAVPWLGLLTGLLGNVSLLSYFAKKRETEAAVVQTLGVVSSYIVLTQLAMGEAMPMPQFVASSAVIWVGLLLNLLYYLGKLSAGIWQFWEDFITVGGISVLPQLMWTTFVPYLPSSILPGTISFVLALTAVIMARTGKLSEKGVKIVGALSGWTATLLFMWMPVAFMWTNFLRPENIKGLSASSMLLAMIGNGLMIPRALLIRDLMWFTGSCWASFFYGYGNIVCMYCFCAVSKELFLATTIGLLSWIGMSLWRDAMVHGHSSPLSSLSDLVSGS